MTDERMSPDVRLREGERLQIERAVLGHTCDCGGWIHSTLEHVGDEVERIVAARVGEVVERVEAVLPESDGIRAEHRAIEERGEDCGCAYKDCYECGKWHDCRHGTVALGDAVRTALRAAQAPPSAEGVASGHGGAGGDSKPLKVGDPVYVYKQPQVDTCPACGKPLDEPTSFYVVTRKCWESE